MGSVVKGVLGAVMEYLVFTGMCYAAGKYFEKGRLDAQAKRKK